MTTKKTLDLGAGALLRVTLGENSVDVTAGGREIAWLELHGHAFSDMDKMGPLSAYLMAWAGLTMAHKRGEFTGEMPESFDDFLLVVKVEDLGEAPGSAPSRGGRGAGKSAS